MKSTRFTVIIALGFFALVAQTLLFRDFLTVFEGNEIGVSAFFASWLAWIALGAALGRIESRAHQALTRRLPWATLLFIPAFIVQHTAVLNARAWIGVEAYVLFPLARMLGMSLLVNAPTSLLTGFLFTRACVWAAELSALPVARVYVLEALGSGLGAVGCTVLLALKVPEETVFLCAAGLVAASASAAEAAPAAGARSAVRIGVLAVATGVIAGAILFGLGERWAEVNCRAAWTRLLPATAYRGCFTTSQGRYLFGEEHGQFNVISGGGVCETLPATEHAGEVVALHLAQEPDARRVLVFGENALDICADLAALPSIETVTWLHPDPQYPRALQHVLDGRDLARAVPKDVPGADVRTFARTTSARYDLILVDLPDVTTLVLNRYCTKEFFALLKTILADGGAISVRVSGGANYMGGELAYLGASMLATLESVFKHTALKPGDESWIIASDGDALTQSPAVLRDRFAGVQGGGTVYPPEAVVAIYPLDRAQSQIQAYRKTIAEAGETVLLNTDYQPRALLFSLLLALKQAGWGSRSEDLPTLLDAAGWVLAAAVALYAGLRWIYRVKSRRTGRGPDLFDARFLITAAGFVGMAMSIVLMFAYQTRFGSLFLDIGLISALFMFGGFLGSFACERLIQRIEHGASGDALESLVHRYLWTCVVVLLASSALPGRTPRAVFLLAFAVFGLYTGAAFPIAAQVMKSRGRPVSASGSSLETLDTLGGAAGALVTGLVLLPALGSMFSVWILAGVVAANYAAVLTPGRLMPAGDGFQRVSRVVGYVLFGAAAYSLVVSHVVAGARIGQEGKRLAAVAREMTGGAEVLEEQGLLDDNTTLVYFSTPDTPDRVGGYLFDTQRLAPNIYGYAGPLNLMVHVDRTGVLRAFRILQSNETPAYLRLLGPWTGRLSSRNLFTPDPFKGLDAVSGATLSSDAVLKTLDTAGRAFATQVLRMDLAASEAAAPASRFRLGAAQLRDALCLTGLAVTALILRYRSGAWARRAILLVSLVVAGILLNLQYSTHQVMSLLGLNLGGATLSGPGFLFIVVPILVVLFGNVYCGYLCPFGAVQELAGEAGSRWLKVDLDTGVWRYGRGVKYLLLFVLVLLFARTRDYGVLSADPLITVFSAARGGTVLAVGAAAVILSLFFPRFWCRTLCPAGAFLSLLNGARLLGRLMPQRYPHQCDLGVQTTTELDCICCDRCAIAARLSETRQPVQARAPGSGTERRTVFLAAVAVMAIVFVAMTVPNTKVWKASGAASTSTQASSPSAGKPRDLDLDKVRLLIRQRYLSDHPAEFYKAAPDQEGGSPLPGASDRGM
jgi:spermidine synthase